MDDCSIYAKSIGLRKIEGMETIKAAIYTQYGPASVLKIVDMEKPRPRDDEILVRLRATSVTSGDVRLRSMNFPAIAKLIVRLVYGFFKPKNQILGHEFSGVVEEVGSQVTKYQVNDEILASTTSLKTGSYVEYICVPEHRKKGVLALKPRNISFNQAAVLPVGGMTALFLLKQAELTNQTEILIYGASGSVGTYAVQIAKEKNATILAVCSSDNFSLVSSLGADECIDYRKEDIFTLNRKFNVVFDAVGKLSKSKAKTLLKPDGVFLTVASITNPLQEDLDTLLESVVNGSLNPAIDRSFVFSEIVAAHEYVETERKKGNVVIEFP